MGSQVERFLQGQESGTPPLGQEPVLRVNSFLRQTDTSQRLRETVGVSDANPAQAARIKDLSERTGLDTGLVRRNPDEVARRFARANFDVEKFATQFPKTAEWLARQPENTEIAWDDLPHLTGIEGIVERILAGGVAGWKQSKQGRIAYDVQQARGQMTGEQKSDLDTLERDIRSLPDGRNFYNKAWLEFGRLVGQMTEGFTHEAGEYGIGGATAGVIAGGLLVAAGAPLATFSALVGGGTAVGSLFGWAEYTRRQEGGQAYLDLSQMRDEQGNAYPEDDVQNAANAVGMINALMEIGGTAIEVLPFKKAFKLFTRKAVTDALVRPTTAKALLEFGKSYTSTLLAETGTEVAQEISNVVAEEWVKTGKAGIPETPEDREAMIRRLSDIATRVAAGMSIMAFPGAFVHGAAINIEARRADRRAQYFTALGEGVKESGTFKQLPSAMQEIIREQTKDGPLENVYFDAQEWNTYWQSQKQDPASIALRVTGSRAQYDEAVRLEGDVIIPTDKYATIIAPTEHNAKLVDLIRTAPNQMSRKEAQEAVTAAERATAEEDTEQEKQRRAEAEEIVTGVSQQMRDAGFAETEVSAYSQLYRQIFSLDAKTSPKELARRYNLSIARITEESTLPTEGAVFNQDDIVKQFMVWKAVSEDLEISQELRNIAFLRARDLEPHARASLQEEIDAANAEYKARTGQDWTYSQSAPRVPAYVVDALDTYIKHEKQRLGEESGTTLLEFRKLKYVEHLRELATAGTGDDLNVFLTTLVKGVKPTVFQVTPEGTSRIVGAENILSDIPELKAWHEDFNRPRPKLTLGQAARHTIHTARNELLAVRETARQTGQQAYADILDHLLRLLNQANPRTIVDQYRGLSKALREQLRKDVPNFELYVVQTMHERTFFQTAFPAGFYSKAERLIEQKMPKQATIKDVQGILKDIKAEERKWLGLDEWLTEQASAFGTVQRNYSDKISKEKVLNFLRANRLEIQEVEKGVADEDARDEAYHDAENAWIDEHIHMLAMDIRNNLVSEHKAEFVRTENGMWSYTFSPAEMWAELTRLRQGRAGIRTEDISEYAGENVESNTAFTGPSGGQGWATKRAASQELARHIKELIQESEALQQEFFDAVEEQTFDVSGEVPYAEWTLPGGENYRVVSFTLPMLVPGFESHTDSAFTVVNQLAWTRLKDRIGPNGERILFVEEIQSDWHQRGREQGYADPKWKLDTTGWTAVLEGNWWQVYDETGHPEGRAQRAYAETEQEAIEIDARRHSQQGVPDAPFRNTWHEFVLKRLIRMAAEQGYDQIAWTTGDQQNERYNLAKVADELRYYSTYQSEEGFGNRLDAYKGGQRVLSEDVPSERLSEYIGKEAADKLLAQPPRKGRTASEVLKEVAVLDEDAATDLQAMRYPHDKRVVINNALGSATANGAGEKKLSQIEKLAEEYAESYDNRPGTRSLKGDEMIVGGQGMRGFYDDMLVRFANNFGKKYGAKAEFLSVRVSAKVEGMSSEDEVKWNPRDDPQQLYIVGTDWHSRQPGIVLSPELKQAALQNEFTLYQSGKKLSPAYVAQEVRDAIKDMQEDAKTAQPEEQSAFIADITALEKLSKALQVNDVPLAKQIWMEHEQTDYIYSFANYLRDTDRFLNERSSALSRVDYRKAVVQWAKFYKEATAEYIDVFKSNQVDPPDLLSEISQSGIDVITRHRTLHQYEFEQFGVLNLTPEQKEIANSKAIKTITRKYAKIIQNDPIIQSAILLSEFEQSYSGKEEALSELQAAIQDQEESLTEGDEFLALRFRGLEQLKKLAVFVQQGDRQGVMTYIMTEMDPEEQFFWLEGAGEMFPATTQWLVGGQLEQARTPEYQEGPLGRIRFGATGVNIELFRNANLSTFIHETGHFFLEVLHDQRDTTPELRRMFDKVTKWMGKTDDTVFTREQHEMWARGFEAYLMEGRAPTAELQSLFTQFKAWLFTVYKSITELNVELTDEVRGVMDRLIASEQEIEAAKKSQNVAPLFTDPELVGKGKWLSDEQAASYAEAVQHAETAASEEMSKKIMQNWQQEQTRLWKAEKAQVREEVAKDADDNKVVRARAILSLGRLPSGAELPTGMEAFKLSREAILADYGKQTLKDLPTPFVWTRDEENGLHPEMAADLLGFDSGKALIMALLNSTEPDEWIETQTRERMRGRKSMFPSIGNLQEEAVKAVHNEKRSQLLLKELDILAAQHRAAFKGLIRKATSRVPPIARVREQAARVIDGKAIRDINPTYYLRAAQRARNNARDALLNGDVTETFAQKLTELLNHELYRAAVQGVEESKRIQRYLSRFDEKNTRARLGRAGGSYLAQVDAIRERFSFTRLTNREIDRKQTLAEWVEEQRTLGYDPPIPEKLLYEAFRKNYRELTLAELRDVRDTVKLINHVATTKNKLLTAAKKRQKTEALEEMRTSAEMNFDLRVEPFDFAPGLAKKIKRGVKGYLAAHHKAEFIFEWLDGHVKNGPFWRYLFKPFADAEGREIARMRQAVREIRRIFSVYTPTERAAWSFQKQTFEGTGTFNKSSVLTLALNWGNEYNRQAVLEGYGWQENQVQQVLDTLDERDWSTVQQVWDFIDSFWPEVSKLEKRLNGLPPEKVLPDAFTTRYGTMRGGYYPIVFDRDLSTKSEALEKSATVRELFGYLGARAMTRHGHTQERIGTGGRAISLSITGLAQHVSDVVHDLTHREAVIDVMSMIRNPEFKEIVERSAGREIHRQLEPWVRYIAARKTDYLNPIEKIISWARQGATAVSLGWKFTTGVAQFLGSTNAMAEIGVLNFTNGMRQVYSKPWRFRRTWEFVTSRSEYMHDRLSNYDRDVRDALKRINVLGTNPIGVALIPVQDSYFKLIGIMDMGVSLPTWLGAYQAAMDGTVEGLEKGNEQNAIDYADASVRKTQGSGSAKDLATVQRGPEIYRAFTMFYTFFAGLLNQFAKAIHLTRGVRDVPQLVATMTLLWFLPAVLQELMLGQHPDLDDDPEEWLKWFAKTELLYPTQSVILIRDVVNGLEYEYNPSAAFDAFDALTEGTKGVGALVTGEEPSRYQVKNIVNTVGYFGHLPTRQLWLTGEYFHDWWTGDVDAENPADFLWHAFVTGVPRE